MVDPTVDKFAEQLRPRLQTENIDIRVLDYIRELGIDGNAFMHMTDEEIKREFPGIIFPDRKKLSKIRDEFVKQNARERDEDHRASIHQQTRTLDPGLENEQQDSVQQMQQKLQKFFCGSSSEIDEACFPLLMTSPMDENKTNLKESFQFLAQVDWKGIFDFDAKHSLYNYLQQEEDCSIKVKTFTELTSYVEERATNGNESDLYKVFEDLNEEEAKTWIFCNGYEDCDQERFDLLEWKRERSKGFKDVVRVFTKYTPHQRARLVILVTSEDRVFIEASDILLRAFQKQWIMIAESRQLGVIWIEGLQKRGVEISNERCFHDLSLVDVNRAILQLTTAQPICLSSNKNRREFYNLDIVNSQEYTTLAAETDVEKLSKTKEEEFYKGNRATWWNFHFNEHVCKRDILEDLKKEVRKLTIEERCHGDNINNVNLYHHPGTGGTTIAMHVLWDMHIEGYNCCLVKRITNATARQILGLYELGVKSKQKIQPVLAVVDNEEEKLNDLSYGIRAASLTKGIEKLVCIILVCSRRSAINEDFRGFYIDCKLSDVERHFFTDKHDELKAKGDRDVENMLGLNIMKENFSEKYIKKTVAQLVRKVKKDDHRYILLYTALLNFYDLSFRGIPISCFDPVVSPNHQVDEDMPEFQTDIMCVSESKLEPLIICVTNSRLSVKNKCLRVSLSLLCKYILDEISQSCSHADIMACFLLSEMFQGKYHDVNFCELMNIVKDIMRKRARNADGKGVCKFPPFIQNLYDDGKVQEAVNCVELVYDKVGAAFLAQQIARIFLETEDLESAEMWAKEAIERQTDSSCLWDTYGHVYKKRLEAIKIHDTQESSTVIRAVKYAFEGYTKFKKEHELSRHENYEIPNTAGLFGQMDIVCQLSMSLKKLTSFAPKDKLRQVYAGELPLPEELSQIPDSLVAWFRLLQDSSYACLAEAEHWKMVCCDSQFYFVNQRASYFLSKRNIDNFIKKLNNIFCADTREITPTTASSEKRQKCIRALGGHSLFSVINRCGSSEDGKKTAVDIFELASLNLRETVPNEWQAYDLTMALASGLTLFSCHDDSLSEEEFGNLLQWSAALYKSPEAGRPSWDKFISMDPFIILLALHWPLDSRKHLPSQCTLEDLKRAFVLAQGTFKQMQGEPAENRIPKRNEPMFFLTNDQLCRSIISKERLIKLSKFWQERRTSKLVKSRTARNLLHRFSGTLLPSGEEVRMTLTSQQRSRTRVDFTIPLFMEENRRFMYNKKVCFSLGIGLGGPVACAVEPPLSQEM